MNPILENKIIELNKANQYECWYLVKQPTEFNKLCYLVCFLKKYKESGVNSEMNFEGFIRNEIQALKTIKPDVDISENYRALRVAAFLGLIIMTSAKYEEAIITDTFNEITNRCNGNYEEINLYSDIIQRQIEKMYISSQIDEASQGIRQEYRLYPVMLLYKVLLELGRSTGEYKISMIEYRYLVATTKRFENFLETLLLIKLLREDEENAKNKFEEFRMKFDNRLIQALKQLDTLVIERESITLKAEQIDAVAKKIFIFEQNPNIFATENYLTFLGSTKTLFQLNEFEGELKENGIAIEEIKDENESSRLIAGCNVLLYGVPGSGKSWTIEHEYCKPSSNVERLVFHPDYTYSDFVGQILPNVADDGQVSYKFTPGPFTTILKDAYHNPDKEYILIIEEINRGNAPAIFGEVFQLLDRKSENTQYDDEFPVGTSEYGITNENIAKVVYGDVRHKIRIPSNLSIIGTMNTSDQNVFTLDTAFQRRWEMKLIENNFEHVDKALADAEILDTGISWKTFCTEINNIIVGNNARMTSAEDKRLGAYFVHLQDLIFDEKMGVLSEGEYDELRKKEESHSLNENDQRRLSEIRKAMKQNRKFPEKVIKYLWDDAFKFNREIVFDTAEYQSLEQVIRKFMYSKGIERFAMFKDNVKDAFVHSEE